jgi:type VI secretion system secreted protein VgrG
MMARLMEIATPLGEDLLFHSMTARESLGCLSEFEVNLLSARNDIPFDKVLSANVTVKVALATGGPRFFNGFVTRFALTGARGRYHQYQASVRPWLWYLTRTSNSRIFQKKKVPDILKEVFGEHPIADFKSELSGTYREWEYCVQYRETDFNFISRLMELEGIYYYFKHIEGRHTLVLSDSYTAHSAYEGYSEISFRALARLRPGQEAITEWRVGQEVQPGRYTLKDYYFEGPGIDRTAKSTTERKYQLSDYEMFDYPGKYVTVSEGEHYARTRLEEAQAQFEIAHGLTNCRGVCSGSLFKLKSHHRGDQAREYLIVETNQQFEYNEYETLEAKGTDYHCAFTAISSRQAFRPVRMTPKPVVQGPQTAIVVGPSGQEIYTDKYGRVKVQFHWDRYGKADENSSCWIRVSQSWAGKRWGAMFVPRIGQEVIVDFLEGDPDQPIITGRVYNGESMPPYALPDEMTKSTVKSYSSKGGGGFNEIRFEDKKGEEQLFLHAERNQDNRVKKDSLEWIGNERHLIVKKDQKEKVEGDKHLTVKGDQNEKVDGTLSQKLGMDLQQKVGAKHALHAGQEIHLKAGMNVVIEAGTGITLKVSSSFINIGPAGIYITGPMVYVNSGGSPGTGSGSSPAPPAEPTEADKAEPGEKAQPAKAGTPPKRVGPYSRQAALFKSAAQSGTPFCEI